jgi:hypothetical protein
VASLVGRVFELHIVTCAATTSGSSNNARLGAQ